MVDEVFFNSFKKKVDQKIKTEIKAQKEDLKKEISIFQEKTVSFDETFPLNQRIERIVEDGKETFRHYELKEGLDLEEIKKDPNWRNNMDYWQEVDVD